MSDAATILLNGNKIAWPTSTGWSCAHRVFLHGRTFCSRLIPDGAVLVERSGKPGSGKCGRCEALYKRSVENRSRRERGLPI